MKLSNKEYIEKDILRTLEKILFDLNYTLEPLYRIDFRKLEDIKKKIYDLENYMTRLRNKSQHIEIETKIDDIITTEEKINLVGVLPTLLLSKKIIRSNKELINFSNDVLNIDLESNSKKPRNYIVGDILNKFINDKNIDYDRINKKISNYIKNRPSKQKLSFFEEWDMIIGRYKINDRRKKNTN